jgi:hypothetical protein
MSPTFPRPGSWVSSLKRTIEEKVFESRRSFTFSRMDEPIEA